METAFAAPAGIETAFDDREILITLPADARPADTPPENARIAAERVQAHLMQARALGDPRFLGYAQAILDAWPTDRMTDRLHILRASLDQSLHRFGPAREQLTRVIGHSVDRMQVIQARLTLANLELVQGHYDAARTQCGQLAREFPGLIATSCLAQVEARTGNPQAAYNALLVRTQQSSAADTTGLIWAEGTLADLAAQLGQPAAATHWQRTLVLAPDDLYTRAQLADWQLARGNPEAVLELTDRYEQVDALAVIRAIAMKRLDHPEADRLTARLAERFAEARWRGTLLHQRDLARFALDIDGNAETALAHALDNWQDQREPLDTRLLLRAALAAGDDSVMAKVRSWLDRHNQRDARYPETPS